jgi:hypothetical protein
MTPVDVTRTECADALKLQTSGTQAKRTPMAAPEANRSELTR